MSEPKESDSSASPSASDDLGPGAADEEASEIRGLVREALSDRPPPADVLSGVQQKIRQRSRGKFYRDGWSTGPHPPLTTYLITALLMLAVSIGAYAALRPLPVTPVSEPGQPATP
jgi:hypothetical protein